MFTSTVVKYVIKSPSSGNQFTFYLLEHGDRALQISKQPDPSKYEKEFDEIKKFVIQNNKFFVKDNDKIKIGKIKIKIIHAPGHTPGSICLLFENKLLTGDTLFVNAIGRTDLPGGDAIKLFESLQKLKKLKDDVEVYPGHDYGDIPFSTIGNEKKNNPYFMCNTKEQFLNLLGLF